MIEPEESCARPGSPRPHTVHCLPDGIIMISMLGDAQGRRARRLPAARRRTSTSLGRWEADNGGMQFNYDFWYQPRHNVMVSSEWARPEHLQPGFKLDDVQGGQVRPAAPLLGLEKRRSRRPSTSARRADPAGSPLPPRPGQRRTASSARPSPAPCGTGTRTDGELGRPSKVIEVEPMEVEGLAVPGAGPDHRPGRLDGRPLAVLLQLAARRRAPVRHQRPGQARS